MKIVVIMLSVLIGQTALAAHAPIPREQLQGADELVNQAKAEPDKCVSNKLECEQYRVKENASRYMTLKDDEACLAEDDDDTATIGCYLVK